MNQWSPRVADGMTPPPRKPVVDEDDATNVADTDHPTPTKAA